MENGENHPASGPSPAGWTHKPAWLKIRAATGEAYGEVGRILRHLSLHTVCQSARCPNQNECWSRRHAAFMILGADCTRRCRFCAVRHGHPQPPDPAEPAMLAEAVERLRLKHVVITSVDRDDLADGGAGHFAACIGALRQANPQTTIEVLTPDFRHKDGAIDLIVAAHPDVFNHNVETVPRLYEAMRPGADYAHSLGLLAEVKVRRGAEFTKSGLMLGLGESDEEIAAVMDDLRRADVDFLTMGQYLRPSAAHAEVARYVTPEAFAALGRLALSKGFKMVSSSPLTRSSHHADEDYARLLAAR